MLCRFFKQFLVFQKFIIEVVFLQDGLYFVIVIFRAPVGVRHYEIALIAQNLVPHIKRGTERSTGIISCRLDKYFLKRRLLKYLPIRQTVLRRAPRETKIGASGLFV